MKVIYKVNFMDVEGNSYTVHNIEAENPYEAESIAANKVNGNKNFGINFQAEFVSF